MELAKAFSTLLKSILTQDELQEVIILNKDNDGCCHTHDYVDANMVMFEAFRSVYGHDMCMSNSTHYELFNIGWHIAKESNFFTD